MPKNYADTICPIHNCPEDFESISAALRPLDLILLNLAQHQILLYCKESSAFFLMATSCLDLFSMETPGWFQEYLPNTAATAYPVEIQKDGSLRDCKLI